MNANQVNQVEVIDQVEAEIVLDVTNYVLAECAVQAGPVVSLEAGKLADMMGVSPQDVLNMTADYGRFWWLEGKRFSTAKAVSHDAYVYGDSEYIEIEVLKIDQDQVIAALLNG